MLALLIVNLQRLGCSQQKNISMDGYLSHELHRCMEVKGKYLLLVRWDSLEAHTIGFRSSPQYQTWKQLLHHFYDPFPTVEHFEEIEIY
jgi:heme-degrading monooxygenase HmoA